MDSGTRRRPHSRGTTGVKQIDEETIRHFEGRMAIVIPTKDEKLRLLEGVVSGVPHDCLVIVVSNSQRKRVDRFRIEGDVLDQLCRFTHRQALIIHQKDPAIAKAAIEADYNDLLDGDGLVRDGKGEAMIVGLLVAKAAGKEYVGFIDADNYFPGSVLEYVRNYAAGFSLAQSPYSMVRILWRYKPKISAGLYFRKWGRISEITNKYLNSLISTKTGFETEIVTTANAGEHALSMQLAEVLPFASGYAVESQELVSLFENFGGILPTKEPKAMEQGIDILQIETRNPHLHEERGNQHLNEILLSSMSTIYHSPLCDREVKQAIMAELLGQGILKDDETPPPIHINAPLNRAKVSKSVNAIRRDIDKYRVH